MLLEAALFCVAGAALGASLARFVWQAQHSEHLHIEVGWSLATRDAFRRHLVLRGWRSTWSTSGSFCVAGSALGAPQARFAWQTEQHITFTHHHLHIIVYTASSTHHHLHSIINTAPSPQHHLTSHHLHNIINTTPSTLHHHILAGAALGALPSYPSCLIPADTPLFIFRGGFFVLFSLTYSTLACPKTLLTCGVIWS